MQALKSKAVAAPAVLATVVIVALGFPIAGAIAAQHPAAPRPTSSAPVAGNATAQATQSDADSQALGLLVALNENEIAAARQAQQKGVAGPYLEFAKLMQTQHGENLRKTRQLGTPGTGAEVEALKSKGRQELAALAKHQGQDYQVAYAQAMVKGHQEALGLIDDRMSELARSAAIKSHLAQTRQHVAAHLGMAKELPATATAGAH